MATCYERPGPPPERSRLAPGAAARRRSGGGRSLGGPAMGMSKHAGAADLSGGGGLAGRGRTARPPTVDHAVHSERLELGASGVFRPRNTRRGRGGRRRVRGGRRSPSTSSSVRLAHPGLAAGVDVAPAAAAELVPGPRTEASRRSGTGAAATDRGVEPDVLPTAGVRLADRTRTFTPPAPGDLSTPSKSRGHASRPTGAILPVREMRHRLLAPKRLGAAPRYRNLAA